MGSSPTHRGVLDLIRSANVEVVGEGRRKIAVLVPVKPFGQAKSRLAGVMSESDREDLAKMMLRNVLAAAQGMRVAIVAPPDANDVRRFALINGARFLPEGEVGGLDYAAANGIAQLAELGYDRVIVVHSDLPLVRDFTWLAETDGIIIVPDRSGQGTNAISIPASSGFQFAFGPGSCQRHEEEARRLGYDPKIVVDPDGLSADLDDPEDAKRLGMLDSAHIRTEA